VPFPFTDTATGDANPEGPIASLPAVDTTPRRALSPFADTVASRLVFAPATQRDFLAAARRGRLLVDLGRVDLDVTRPASRMAAYREAVAARSPVSVGTRLRVRGPWGADDAEVDGFDWWNGRIVATLKAPPRVVGLARAIDPLLGVAYRADSARDPADLACVQPDTFAMPELGARLDAVRDSVLQSLRANHQPTAPQFRGELTSRSSRVLGCFDGGVALLFASIHAGDYEWARERALLVDSTGAVRPLEIIDFRFRVHEALHALDADENRFDDVATRAWTAGGGGSVVLRVVGRKRLERVASGFAWER
jgi:hypothetical protein